MTRRERFLALLAILAGFAVYVALGYLSGPAPEPKSCLSACATSRSAAIAHERASGELGGAR